MASLRTTYETLAEAFKAIQRPPLPRRRWHSGHFTYLDAADALGEYIAARDIVPADRPSIEARKGLWYIMVDA